MLFRSNVVLKADLERDALLREAETAHDPHRIAEIQTRLVDIDAHSAPARAAAILSGLGFSTSDQARPCAEFSGGWRMRVALAATLFSAPDLLLLDEPTAGMAPRERIELMRLTARIAREQSIGVLFTEHDMDVVFEHADRILVLNRGSLIAEGSPEEVRGNAQVRAIYLGEGLLYDARHREGASA